MINNTPTRNGADGGDNGDEEVCGIVAVGSTPDDNYALVELATLTLPTEAIAGDGLTIGQNDTHVVLEASRETIDIIQESSNTTSQMISAVVDLEKLSDLVGISEVDKFVTGLHQDVQEQKQRDAEEEAEPPAAAMAKEGEGAIVASEESPLLVEQAFVGTGSAGTPTGVDSTTESETEQLALPVDPFLERLVEVLPTVDEGTVLGEESLAYPPCIIGGGGGGDGSTIAAAIASTTLVSDSDADDRGEDVDTDYNVGEEAQHLAHDAFLIKATGYDDHHHEKTKYVLALPEILLPPLSSQTVASDISEHSAWFLDRFEKGMERAMSILPTELPSDVQAVHLEATEHVPTKADPTTVHLDIVVDRKVPVIGYIILFSGLLALSSVGAALDLQQGGVTPVMKTLWRQMATCIVLLPLVIVSLRRDGQPNLTLSEWMLLPVSAISYTYMTLAFVVALEMTTMANAFVLSNMTSLVIIAARAAIGLPVLFAEGTGAIIGFLGAAICASGDAVLEDPSQLSSSSAAAAPPEDQIDVSSLASSSSPHHLAMYGNLIALSASFGTAGYLLIAKNLRPKMDLFTFMFLVMGIGGLFLLCVTMFVLPQEVTFDLHPVHGLFGWLNIQADRLPIELYLAVVCNCLGTTGYIAVLKYFDAIVPATVMLLEPVAGALLGVLAGTASFPGIQIWLGDLVVAAGTFLVIRAGAKTTESINATEALRPRLATFDEKRALLEAEPSCHEPDDNAGCTTVIWNAANKPPPH